MDASAEMGKVNTEDFTTPNDMEGAPGDAGYGFVYDRTKITVVFLVGATVFHVCALIASRVLRYTLPTAYGIRADFARLPLTKQNVLGQRVFDVVTYSFVVYAGARIVLDKIKNGTWNSDFMFFVAQYVLPYLAGMYVVHLLTRSPGTAAGFNDAMFWAHHIAAWGSVSYVVGLCPPCAGCDFNAPERNAVFWIGTPHMLFDELTSMCFNTLAFLYSTVQRPPVWLAYVFYATWYLSVFSHLVAYTMSFVAYGLNLWDLPAWLRFYVFLPWTALVASGHCHTHYIYRILSARFLVKAKLQREKEKKEKDGQGQDGQGGVQGYLEKVLENTAAEVIQDVASPRNKWHGKLRRMPSEDRRRRLVTMSRAELADVAKGAGLPEAATRDMDASQIIAALCKVAAPSAFGQPTDDLASPNSIRPLTFSGQLSADGTEPALPGPEQPQQRPEDETEQQSGCVGSVPRETRRPPALETQKLG
eukprot:Hpha_TRINITY_DN15313_c2_g5::TRINITY_DN15313_c2_g5_i1::g.90165::m.90165